MLAMAECILHIRFLSLVFCHLPNSILQAGNVGILLEVCHFFGCQCTWNASRGLPFPWMSIQVHVPMIRLAIFLRYLCLCSFASCLCFRMQSKKMFWARVHIFPHKSFIAQAPAPGQERAHSPQPTQPKYHRLGQKTEPLPSCNGWCLVQFHPWTKWIKTDLNWLGGSRLFFLVILFSATRNRPPHATARTRSPAVLLDWNLGGLLGTSLVNVAHNITSESCS